MQVSSSVQGRDLPVSAAISSSATAINAGLTIEEAAGRFQLWRLSKSGKFDPIPDYLKEMVILLLESYSPSQIVAFLKINHRMIASIKDAYATSKPSLSLPLSPKSKGKISGKLGGAKQPLPEMSFIPFDLTLLQRQASSVSACAASATAPVCHIRNGSYELVIYNPDLASVIRSFLCSS